MEAIRDYAQKVEKLGRRLYSNLGSLPSLTSQLCGHRQLPALSGLKHWLFGLELWLSPDASARR